MKQNTDEPSFKSGLNEKLSEETEQLWKKEDAGCIDVKHSNRTGLI